MPSSDEDENEARDRAVVMGAFALPTKLAKSARKHGGRLWIELRAGKSNDAIDRIAKKLGGDVRVVVVEMPQGLRGDEMTAVTYIAPGGEDEVELTEIANEIFDSWEVHGPFDEEVAALALAWELVAALSRAMKPPL